MNVEGSVAAACELLLAATACRLDVHLRFLRQFGVPEESRDCLQQCTPPVAVAPGSVRKYHHALGGHDSIYCPEPAVDSLSQLTALQDVSIGCMSDKSSVALLTASTQLTLLTVHTGKGVAAALSEHLPKLARLRELHLVGDGGRHLSDSDVHTHLVIEQLPALPSLELLTFQCVLGAKGGEAFAELAAVPTISALAFVRKHLEDCQVEDTLAWASSLPALSSLRMVGQYLLAHDNGLSDQIKRLSGLTSLDLQNIIIRLDVVQLGAALGSLALLQAMQMSGNQFEVSSWRMLLPLLATLPALHALGMVHTCVIEPEEALGLIESLAALPACRISMLAATALVPRGLMC
jgi:hypothetical protein